MSLASISVQLLFTETIHTKHTYNKIGSVKFIKLPDLPQMLLVAGECDFGLEIYEKPNDKHVLRNTVQFEDSYYWNLIIPTDKYIFVKA